MPCHFHCCHPFYCCSSSNIAAFHSTLNLSFVELPFLLWSCRCHIHFAAKDIFLVTTGRRPIFFAFLVVVLIIFTPSCCSYCHCSTGSNSHTVVLSKSASYSPALFSIPAKRREHAYQSFMLVYGTGKVRWLCGYSMLAGAVKVRLRYAVSKVHVLLKYGKSTVKYSKRIVLYGYFFWRLLYIHVII